MNHCVDATGRAIEGSNFPFYFLHRDERGDVQVGKQFGPDGSQVSVVMSCHVMSCYVL
jgi:hypothetical protein